MAEQLKEAGIVRAGRSFDSILGRVTYIILITAGILILLMAVLYTYGSLRRYIFSSPDALAYVGVAILMLIIGVTPLAGVQMLREHISVDFLGGRLPPLARDLIVYLIAPLMGLVFNIALIYTSWGEAMYALETQQHTMAVATIPTFPFKILVPIFSGLLSVVLIAQVVSYIASFFMKKSQQ